MKKYIIGIDPGEKGGIAILDTNGTLVEAVTMPQTPADIYSYLKGHDFGDDSICYLEDVGRGMPGQSSKATATFARHNGHLEMALLACGVPTEKVTPAKWQTQFKLGSKKEEPKTSHKNRIKAFAQSRFGNPKITLATADAIVIALYGYENEK
ncbi:MAG: hypothetical protein NC548_42120 [Lachnospiraceae bacterium]|nr:hypothetical protein [Lachnospiraceae bacterium]